MHHRAERQHHHNGTENLESDHLKIPVLDVHPVDPGSSFQRVLDTGQFLTKRKVSTPDQRSS